jgi:RNA polymerase sigma factor (sigma-70 family)
MTTSRTTERLSATPSTVTDRLESLYRAHSLELSLWLGAHVPAYNVEDASQAVWERILTKYETHFDGENFRAWMFAVARNYLIDQSRRRTEAPWSEELDPTPPTEFGPLDILIDKEFRARLAACISALGHPREAIVRARMHGEDYAECAKALKLKIQQARQLFFKSKELLRNCMRSSCTRSA